MSQLEVPTLPSQLALLEGFYGFEIHELWSAKPWRGKGLLMGCPVWGERYLDRFESFCLPSIMAPANYEALKGQCRLVFFTDIPSYARVVEFTEPLEDIGFDVQIRKIPNELMEIHNAKDPLIKYWILGVCSNVCIQMAKRAGMAYHQLHPDHVYEATYYPNLFRLAAKYEGIAQTSISVSVETAAPEINKFIIENGSLSISGRDLGDIGYRHMHKQTLATMMNTATIPAELKGANSWRSYIGHGDLPESHLWIWQGRDKLFLACCHMNMAYLSAAMCGVAKSRIPATVDAELPFFMPKEFYVPTAEDGMMFIEVSDADKAHNPRRVDIIDFAKHCWLKTRYSRAWMPYVEKFCEVPIHPQEKFAHESRVNKEHQQLMKLLLDIRGPDTIATDFIESLGFQ